MKSQDIYAIIHAALFALLIVAASIFFMNRIQAEAKQKTITIATAEISRKMIHEKPIIIESAPKKVEEIIISETPAAVEENVEEIAPENEYTEIFESMTEAEYELLAQILALAAQTEPFEGQVAVLEVIMNRVLSDGFPNTVYGVISQGDGTQFNEWWYLDDPYNTPQEEQYEAIKHVSENGLSVLKEKAKELGYDHPEKYVFFATYKANGRDFIKIGHHYFGRAK